MQNTNLALRQLMNLGQQCNGMRVQQVMLYATTNGQWAQATLMVNNQPATYAQAIGTGPVAQYDFYLHPNYNRLGQNIQTLQMQIQGLTYVDYVGIVLGY